MDLDYACTECLGDHNRTTCLGDCRALRFTRPCGGSRAAKGCETKVLLHSFVPATKCGTFGSITVNQTTTTQLSGWGNWRPQPCHVARPRNEDDLLGWLGSVAHESWIARGLGRSYGDAAVNAHGGVLLLEHYNHLLAFSPDEATIDCQAGVTLGEILEVIVPRGLFLPVTPGTKFVTLGGAIAADVHGKNHHRDGNLSNYIVDLELMLADGQRVVCSPRENAQLYWATVGGMGLTGVILRAKIRLLAIESAYMQTECRRLAHLDELLAAFPTSDNEFRYSVAWIDGLATGRQFGRSVLMLGNHAKPDDLKPSRRAAPLQLPSHHYFSVPCHAPGWFLRQATVRAFNAWTYFRHPPHRRVVDLDRYFYPLDRLWHWNRMYGRRGFIEYQAVLPEAEARRTLIRLLERIQASDHAPCLAGLKATGAKSQGLLAFLEPGYTIGMDFPYRDGLIELLHELDALVLDAGGRIYLAKDATMQAHTFAASYPRLAEFRQIKAALDPHNRFNSSLARRLGIVE